MTKHAQRHLRDNDHLFLHEELMLLALRDEEGTVISSSTIVYTLAGALLGALMLEERIAFTDDKKRYIEVKNDEPLGDAILDECIGLIQDAKKPKTLKEWVLKFVHLKDLKTRVIQSLVDRHIVHADEASVLLFFSQKVYPQTDPGPERSIVERLRRAIFRGTRDVEPRTVALLALAKAAGLLNHHFEGSDLRERKDRIKEIVSGEATARAAKQASEAAQAAAMVAVMAATTAATSSASRR